MTTANIPTTSRRPRALTRPLTLTLAFVMAAAGAPAQAQNPPGRGLPIIRDAEIEQLLRDYSQPILRTAGLAKQNVRVVIINDRAFNAFVADGHRIFVNAGALMESESPNQIIGVFAHETGHIAGGHLSRLRDQLAKAQTQSIVAMLLGVGAMVAGASAGARGGGNIGVAALTMPQELIRRSLLAYQRTQEDQADRAAVKFLTATHQSAKGMHDTFKRFADQSLFISHGADPFVQSHPMPAERLAGLQDIARANPYWDKKDPPNLQLRHDLMRAKLFGFIERPEAVLRHYPPQDVSLPARYARAIASYRSAGLRDAITQVDSLIQTQPSNPYFHELKGQALMESGRAAEAVAPLRRAAQLAQNPVLIQALLGQAMVATNDAKLTSEAVAILRRVVTREPELAEAYTQLAMAYGRSGSLAEADLASAHAAAMRGDIPTARQLAARAKTRFPVGSPGWIKADDIVGLKPPPSPLPGR
ncbi:MAG: M48 family metalloprotease [Rhizobiales bacterium]|nr:M48 family metalloprotease [Hyphomicrobiales bacterium]